MKCQNCGRDLPESAKFCLECGVKVEQNLVCPSCGKILPPDAKFCLECGASVVKIADEDKDDIDLTDGFIETESYDNGTDRVLQTYIDDHSELEWISNIFGDTFFYAISAVDESEILQRYILEADEKTVSAIQAKNFQLFRIEQEGQAEVRILAEFEDEIKLFNYDGYELITIHSSFKDNGRLQYMYYGWDGKQEEQNCAILLNLITGRYKVFKYDNAYEWNVFTKNEKKIISYINHTQDEKRRGLLMWDDGPSGFHIIPAKEWEQLGGFPNAKSRPEQLEAKGYLEPSVMAYEIPWNLYQNLSELQKYSRVNTEEEVRQFVRNYLQIIGYVELKDLGSGYYYLHCHNNGGVSWWSNYAILNLNAIGDFMEMNEYGFRQLYSNLFFNPVTATSLHRGNVLISCHEAYDWISKPVDGKMYCLAPDDEYGYEKYRYLHILDLYDLKERDGMEEASVEILAYTSGENRILINSNAYGAFFIFDLEGNLILKKEGKYGNAGSYFGYRLLNDYNNFRCTGLYDEITGTEILPCQYQDFDMWVKNEGHSQQYRNKEIYLIGQQRIDKGPNNKPDYKKEYFRYDPQTGEVSIMTETQMLPLYAGLRSEESAKLGYENLVFVKKEVSEPITLDSLDPEVAEQRRKNRKNSWYDE